MTYFLMLEILHGNAVMERSPLARLRLRRFNGISQNKKFITQNAIFETNLSNC